MERRAGEPETPDCCSSRNLRWTVSQQASCRSGFVLKRRARWSGLVAVVNPDPGRFSGRPLEHDENVREARKEVPGNATSTSESAFPSPGEEAGFLLRITWRPQVQIMPPEFNFCQKQLLMCALVSMLCESAQTRFE
jgi:hypothetical protein